MNRLIENIRSFMVGRYGTDALSGFILALYFLVGIIRIFIRQRTAYIIISALMTLLLIIIFYRIFSKNIERRTKENMIFLRFYEHVRPHLVLLKDRIRDIRTKRYRRCPCCKHVLRLPYKRGKHSVRCPHCSKNFEVHIL